MTFVVIHTKIISFYLQSHHFGKCSRVIFEHPRLCHLILIHSRFCRANSERDNALYPQMTSLGMDVYKYFSGFSGFSGLSGAR